MCVCVWYNHVPQLSWFLSEKSLYIWNVHPWFILSFPSSVCLLVSGFCFFGSSCWIFAVSLMKAYLSYFVWLVSCCVSSRRSLQIPRPRSASKQVKGFGVIDVTVWEVWLSPESKFYIHFEVRHSWIWRHASVCLWWLKSRFSGSSHMTHEQLKMWVKHYSRVPAGRFGVQGDFFLAGWASAFSFMLIELYGALSHPHVRI